MDQVRKLRLDVVALFARFLRFFSATVALLALGAGCAGDVVEDGGLDAATEGHGSGGGVVIATAEDGFREVDV